MRPTNLSFRSPKEKTPGPYAVSTSNRGTELFTRSHGRSFVKGQRFTQYTLDMRRTGPQIGPGSYTQFASKRRIGPVLRPVSYMSHKQSEACTYIGDQLVIDPDLRRTVQQRASRRRLTRTRSVQKQRPKRKSNRSFLSMDNSKRHLSSILKTKHSQIKYHLRTLTT